MCIQGVRLSSHAFSAILWYASQTNATFYNSDTSFLDTDISGYLYLSPPILLVNKNDEMEVVMEMGRVSYKCTSKNEVIHNVHS